MRRLWLLVILLAGCGDSSPAPAPPRPVPVDQRAFLETLARGVISPSYGELVAATSSP